MPGGTDRSYGVHVARLADRPKKACRLGSGYLAEEYDLICETACQRLFDNTRGRKETAPMGLLAAAASAQQILKMDVMGEVMTPIEALE